MHSMKIPAMNPGRWITSMYGVLHSSTPYALRRYTISTECLLTAEHPPALVPPSLPPESMISLQYSTCAASYVLEF